VSFLILSLYSIPFVWRNKRKSLSLYNYGSFWVCNISQGSTFNFLAATWLEYIKNVFHPVFCQLVSKTGTIKFDLDLRFTPPHVSRVFWCFRTSTLASIVFTCRCIICASLLETNYKNKQKKRVKFQTQMKYAEQISTSVNIFLYDTKVSQTNMEHRYWKTYCSPIYQSVCPWNSLVHLTKH
jgi:hypothetical protein